MTVNFAVPFRAILGTYLAAFLAFAIMGALIVVLGEQARPAHSPVDGATLAPGDFLWMVLTGNTRVWLFLCLGTVTLGSAGAVVLVGNALRFGMDAMALSNNPGEYAFLLPHAVIEFWAFTLAAAACQYFGLRLLDTLTASRTAREDGARVATWALAWSLNFVVMGALVETMAHVSKRSPWLATMLD